MTMGRVDFHWSYLFKAMKNIVMKLTIDFISMNVHVVDFSISAGLPLATRHGK
jgi:hypothetical protein